MSLRTPAKLLILLWWRRGRDSNPRYGCPYAAFRVRCSNPFCWTPPRNSGSRPVSVRIRLTPSAACSLRSLAPRRSRATAATGLYARRSRARAPATRTANCSASFGGFERKTRLRAQWTAQEPPAAYSRSGVSWSVRQSYRCASSQAGDRAAPSTQAVVLSTVASAPHSDHVRESHPKQWAGTLCHCRRHERARQPRTQLSASVECRAEPGSAGDPA